MSIINSDNLKNILSKFKEKIYTSINKNSNDILQLSNPNLLINGDFRIWDNGEIFNNASSKKPIANKWISYNWSTISKSENGLLLTGNTIDGTAGIEQAISLSDLKFIDDTVFTISFMGRILQPIAVGIYGISLKEFSVNSEWKKYTMTLNVPFSIMEKEGIRVIIAKNTTGNFGEDVAEFKWIKLESGKLSTTFIPKSYNDELLLSHDNLRLLSNPNLLINGDFQVWQRGEEFLNVDIYRYTADRWYTCNVGGFNVSKIENGIKCWRDDTTGWLAIGQPILLSEISENLKGKTVTFSFYIKNMTNIPSVNTYIADRTSTNSICLVSEDNKTTGFHSYTFQIPDNCDKFIVELCYQSKELESSFEIEYAKLEVGEFATPFIPRSYGEEKMLCQRYYESLERCIGYNGTDEDICRGRFEFKVEKRIDNATVKIFFNNIENKLGYVKDGTVYTIEPQIIPKAYKDSLLIDTPLGIANYGQYEFNAIIDNEIY